MQNNRRLSALEALATTRQQRQQADLQPVMRLLSDADLDSLISAAEKGHGATFTETEQAAISRFAELAEKAGITWAS